MKSAHAFRWLAVSAVVILALVAPATATTTCSCNTSTTYSVSGSQDGASCTAAHESLAVSLYDQADANCHALGYDISCWDRASYNACTCDSMYHQSGTLLYSCGSCYTPDEQGP
jgi:hypothetical protein